MVMQLFTPLRHFADDSKGARSSARFPRELQCFSSNPETPIFHSLYGRSRLFLLKGDLKTFFAIAKIKIHLNEKKHLLLKIDGLLHDAFVKWRAEVMRINPSLKIDKVEKGWQVPAVILESESLHETYILCREIMKTFNRATQVYGAFGEEFQSSKPDVVGEILKECSP